MFTLSSSALWRCQVCLKKQRAYFSSQETDRRAGFPWPIFVLDGCSADIQPSRDESHWAPPGKKAQLRWSGGQRKKLSRDWCMEEKTEGLVQVWQKKGVTAANIVYSRQSGILIKATEEEEKDGEKTWSLPKTAAPSPTPAIKVKLSWWTPGLRGALLTPI